MTAGIEELIVFSCLIWFMVGYFTVLLLGMLYDYNWVTKGKGVNKCQDQKEVKTSQNCYECGRIVVY